MRTHHLLIFCFKGHRECKRVANYVDRAKMRENAWLPCLTGLVTLILTILILISGLNGHVLSNFFFLKVDILRSSFKCSADSEGRNRFSQCPIQPFQFLLPSGSIQAHPYRPRWPRCFGVVPRPSRYLHRLGPCALRQEQDGHRVLFSPFWCQLQPRLGPQTLRYCLARFSTWGSVYQ